MKKISLWVVVAVLCLSLLGAYSLAGCKAETQTSVAEETTAPAETEAPATTKDAEEKPEEAVSLSDFETGYVIPSLEGWFKIWDTTWNVYMEKYGVATSGTLTGWDAEKDLQGVRDMIAKGVDAIVLTSTNPDPAQMACKEANDAGIPIAVDSSSVAEGPGKPFLDITFDYYDMGELAGNKVAELDLGTKVVHMAGIPGFAPTVDQDNALKDVGESTGAYELVATEYSNYSMEESLKLMKDIIQSGKEFDVIVCCSQEAASGTIEALKQEGLLGKKVVISVNGGPLDVENFEAGTLDYAIGQSPGLLALITGSFTLNYLQGIDPFSQKIRPPFQWLTPENYKDEIVPWEVDESWIPIAEKYTATGELVLK
jgi:ribose transport system substrate-binding protein